MTTKRQSVKSARKSRVFWLHFNRFNAKRGDKECWTVHTSKGCIFTHKVNCKVAVESIYKGDTAPQPRAFFKGKGIVTKHRDGSVTIA